MIDFTVNGAPKGKGRPRFARATGHAYTPTPTVNHEALIRLHAQLAMHGGAPIAGPIALTITATFAVPASWSKKRRAAALNGTTRPTTKPDFYNCAKLCDALNGVVWLDDKQVVDGRVVKVYGEQPGTRFVIEQLL